MLNLAKYQKKLNDAKYAVVTCMMLTLVIAWLQLPHHDIAHNLMRRVDSLIYDVRFKIAPLHVAEHPQQIAIIDIDEKSLKAVGRFPWSRKTIARLVTRLHTAGVASIAFDVMFPEPENNIALSVAKELDDPIIKNQLEKFAHTFDYDIFLANTIKNRDVILGYALSHDNNAVSTMPPSTIAIPEDTLKMMLVGEMQGYTANIPALQQAAAGNGFMNADPDMDGSVRRAPLILRYGDHLYASLALQTVMNYLLVSDITPNIEKDWTGTATFQGFTLADHIIHTDTQGRMLIPYRGPQKTFPYFSASDVLNGSVNAEQLAGKIVIVGTSATGLNDLRTTPVGINYPGVESQATLIDSLLQGDAPYQPDWTVAGNIVVIFMLGFLLCLIMPLCGPLTTTIIGVGSLSLIGYINFWLWSTHYLDLPASGPLLTVTLVYVVNISYGFFSTSHQKTQMKSMFGQYVAPAHIDRLLNDESALSFEGESKEMTVLFSDVRNFTAISEKLTAHELKNLLNHYFTPMTEIIFDQQGTIDKYVGDMIMAFWGAPLNDPNQKEHAVATALLMLEKTNALQSEFKKMGLPEVKVGIGINTGMMNVGDMGSTYRRAYTVLGDAVNLGSRLESITKFYGVACLISETTKAGLDGKFIFREVDYVQVKGKKEAIRIYEPVAFTHQTNESLNRNIALYEKARSAYLNKAWPEAAQLFTELHEQDISAQKIASVYLARIADYANTTLPPDWCGIWQHADK